MSALRRAARCAALAALLAASGARGEPPPPAKKAPPARRAAAATPPPAAPARRVAPRAVSWPDAERAQVTPGILVRAAKRAQQREGAACSPCTSRPDAAQGEVEAIEIDWHAASPTP